MKSLKQKLTYQSQQNWESICNNSSKSVLYIYSYMKQVFDRFRTSNHRLPIETGK